MTLNQEAYVRVQGALETGAPRKRVFSDVALELNALGYRNARNQPLRAATIERVYYQARRNRRLPFVSRRKSRTLDHDHFPRPFARHQP